MRIYQSANCSWILLLNDNTKIYFKSLGEAQYMEKKIEYVETFRQWVRDYQQIMQRAWTLNNNYGLYGSILTESDMPGDIIVNPDKLTAFISAFANLQSIFNTYDAGIDDNFERVA